jgi:hypothetical protein
VRDRGELIADGFNEERGRELLVTGHFSARRKSKFAFADRAEGGGDESVGGSVNGPRRYFD